MANRSEDWWRQALRDLEHAEASREDGRHEWACFAAHQAAGKAVKALHLRWGQEAWGHVVATLLARLPSELDVPDRVVEEGRPLDNFHVPTGCPNGHGEGAPFKYYGPLQSEQALDHAGSIVEFVRSNLA